MNYLYILYLSHFYVEMQNQLLKTENAENGHPRPPSGTRIHAKNRAAFTFRKIAFGSENSIENLPERLDIAFFRLYLCIRNGTPNHPSTHSS